MTHVHHRGAARGSPVTRSVEHWTTHKSRSRHPPWAAMILANNPNDATTNHQEDGGQISGDKRWHSAPSNSKEGLSKKPRVELSHQGDTVKKDTGNDPEISIETIVIGSQRQLLLVLQRQQSASIASSLTETLVDYENESTQIELEQPISCNTIDMEQASVAANSSATTTLHGNAKMQIRQVVWSNHQKVHV